MLKTKIKVQLEVVAMLLVVDFQIYLVVILQNKEELAVLKDKAINNKVDTHLILVHNKINNNNNKKNELEKCQKSNKNKKLIVFEFNIFILYYICIK